MSIRIHRARLGMSLVALAAFVVPLFSTGLASAQTKKVLNRSTSEPDTIDPQVGSYVGDVGLANALFRGLLRYDVKNNPVPSIAKEVPTVENGGVSADGKTYTYHLRTDWKWSDGKGVVMAKDFVYAWQRLVNPKIAAGYGSFFDGLILNADTINNTDPAKVDQALLDTLGVKAVDDFTVQFTLVHAASYFNQIACMWVGYAVRKDNVERNGLDPSSGAWLDPANGPVVGSGPFIITTWDHNKEIILDKNPNFSGSLAKLDEVNIQIITDAAISYAGFKAGTLDIAGFPIVELGNIEKDPVLSKELLKYPDTCSYYNGMDNTKPPFNNIDVRKAFSYAEDRDTLNIVINGGLQTKHLSFLPPSIAGSDPTLGSDYDFNPDKAKASLAKAGYPNGKGFPTVNYHYFAGANGQRAADWYQAQFKKYLNITISEDPMDPAVFQSATTQPKDKLDGMYGLGWCADYLHPSDWLIPVFGSNGDVGNAVNASGFKDPQFDKVASQADQEVDPVKALALYQQAQKILVDDVPVIFESVGVNARLVSPKVTNLPTSDLDSGFSGSYFWEDIDVAAS